jgi:hypothetical protein
MKKGVKGPAEEKNIILIIFYVSNSHGEIQFQFLPPVGSTCPSFERPTQMQAPRHSA